ncbi:MAG: NAD-dependent protein deacetylase [Pseudomonadota bacterium]
MTDEQGAANSAISRLGTALLNGNTLTVLTGAGISTDSGIPAYRDHTGRWLASQPIQHQEFISDLNARQRYWARSILGWPAVAAAQPNTAHSALVELEKRGLIDILATQNVDRLHQRAGQRKAVDLHGRLDQVVCLSCDRRSTRADLQNVLAQENPSFAQQSAVVKPDGDSDVSAIDVASFRVPACDACGGILKPDVVFFGGSVSRDDIARVKQSIDSTSGLLVIGSSLQVFSGYRFCKYVTDANKPLYIINRGDTRADHLATEKFTMGVAECLTQLL